MKAFTDSFLNPRNGKMRVMGDIVTEKKKTKVLITKSVKLPV